jgi:hypothetical protein
MPVQTLRKSPRRQAPSSLYEPLGLLLVSELRLIFGFAFGFRLLPGHFAGPTTKGKPSPERQLLLVPMGKGAGSPANPLAERTFPAMIFTTLADQNLVQR